MKPTPLLSFRCWSNVAGRTKQKALPTMYQVLLVSLVVTGLSACQKPKSSTSETSTTSQTTQTTTVDGKTAVSSAPIANDELQLLSSDVFTAKAERFQPNVSVTGTLQVSEKTAVQSTVNAQVQQVLVDVGHRVQAGQPLVRLDISGSKDQLAQAQADLAGAQAQAKVAASLAQKNKILFEKGFVAQIEYERSLADATAQQEAVKARLAQVNSAKRMAGDTTITAPAGGVIGTRNVQVGQVVAPNQPLMEIINPNKLEFAANVPSEAQSQLSVGQSVPFTVANNPTQFVGQISRIAPQVDPITRQLTIYVAVKPNQDNQSLKAGMFATGRVDYGQLQVGVLLPMSAVTLNSQQTTTASTAISGKNLAKPAQERLQDNQPAAMIWVVGQDHRLRRQPVSIIRRYDDTSQYLVAGIEQGTIVVGAQLSADAAGKKVVVK